MYFGWQLSCPTGEVNYKPPSPTVLTIAVIGGKIVIEPTSQRGCNATDYRIMVDWISFTVPIDFSTLTAEYRILEKLNEALGDSLEDTWHDITEWIVEWIPQAGRPPYSRSFRAGQGIVVYFNTKVDNVLVEISGQGCEYLREIGVLNNLVETVKSRMTRIDIAVDLKTDVTPSDFVQASHADRFKSRSFVTSETGETVYIGSRKSERYCRVYRYAPPHPRTELIRTEFVFRKQSAKILAQQILDSQWNLTALALGAGQVYGFQHPCWNMSGDEIALTSYSPERRDGKTMFWLLTQVVPAFKKLVKQGAIADPEKFLRTYFLDEKDD